MSNIRVIWVNLLGRYVQWVLLLGLMPLVLFQLQRGFALGFEQTVWLIQFYFCMLWVIYMYRLIKPAEGSWQRALGYAFFTLTTGLPLLIVTLNLPIISDLYPRIESGSLMNRLVHYIIGVGIAEELTKALPLLLFGVYRGQIKSAKEGLFLGFMSGVAFAMAEGVQYTIVATMHAHVVGAVSEQFMQLIFRLMTGPLLHGALAGIVGWFIGMSAREERRWPTIVVGVLLAGVLHGLYNSLAVGWLGVGMAALIFITFLMYAQYEVPVEADTAVEA